jgi:hypothetical protein
MTWKQFSLYPSGCRNRFQPLQVLHEFLPRFIAEVDLRQWHVFFEPSALIRMDVVNPDGALIRAQEIADDLGLVFEEGDCSHAVQLVVNSKVDWPGGSEALGTLEKEGLKFFQAASELALKISQLDHDKQFFMTRKFLHVYLNTLGMNYLEESTFCRYHADRAVELMQKYYRM